MSRLHRVLGPAGPGAVDVEDVDGTVHRVSLLALDGPVPAPGEWLVVHSGYAIDRVDATDAEAVATELRLGTAAASGRLGTAAASGRLGTAAASGRLGGEARP